MNKPIAVLSLLLTFFLTHPCAAGEPYIGILAGGSGGFDLKESRLETSVGYYAGGRIGFKFFSLFRLEEEISYQHAGVHSLEKNGIKFHHAEGHVNFWSLMTNILIDFDCPFILSPYFGGGAGYSHGSGHGSGKWNALNKKFLCDESKHMKAKFNHHEFAWQFIVGLKYFVCLGLEASLEYRYFKLEDANVNHKLGIALTKFF